MTPRLDASETDVLRRDYIERTSRAELMGRVVDEELPHFAEALERLGR